MDFLLELGCENIPSGYLDSGLRQLKRIFESGLAEERLEYGSVEVGGTPNRMVLRITSVAGRQRDLEEIVSGPPVSVGLTDTGEYTEAALGFARAQGAGRKKLTTIKKKKGEYIALVKKTEGRKTGLVLRDTIPGWIGDIKFPKVMRWDSSNMEFARPVRWILSLMGKNTFRFKLGNLESANLTRLDPLISSYTRVGGVEEYYSLMSKNRIVLDSADRRKRVRRALASKAAKAGGRVVEDEELVGIVANLLEYPVALTGRFEERFLRLPREVVVTALKSHQKYFSVEDESGRLKPVFISFADGVRRNRKEIAKGNERVLQARLADAEFYYKEDTAEPISAMAARLEDIIWIEGLGTLAEKAERLEKLALWIKSQWLGEGGGLDRILSRAAELAKADLASEMVKDGKEFTLLQGYIGREYALVSGEDPLVAGAIYEHYLPRFADDILPEQKVGLILSCADKLDNISGGFIMGLEPTGSQDPYALRRQSMAILRIMSSGAMDVSLSGAIDKSLSLFKNKKDLEGKVMEGISGRIREFFVQRFIGILRKEGFSHDIVMAVMGGCWEAPIVAINMVEELTAMRNRDTLFDFILAMKRISNILPSAALEKIQADPATVLERLAGKDVENLPFGEELFEEEAESALFREAASVGGKIIDIQKRGEVHKVFTILSSDLTGPVNRYFDNVLVNCDQKDVRENRILFLASLDKAFSQFCDFSKITEE